MIPFDSCAHAEGFLLGRWTKAQLLVQNSCEDHLKVALTEWDSGSCFGRCWPWISIYIYIESYVLYIYIYISIYIYIESYVLYMYSYMYIHNYIYNTEYVHIFAIYINHHTSSHIIIFFIYHDTKTLHYIDMIWYVLRPGPPDFNHPVVWFLSPWEQWLGFLEIFPENLRPRDVGNPENSMVDTLPWTNGCHGNIWFGTKLRYFLMFFSLWMELDDCYNVWCLIIS